MDDQEAFMRSATHVLGQTQRATYSGVCVYATPDGGACGVGCLLTRDLAEALDRLALQASWQDFNLPTSWKTVVAIAGTDHPEAIRAVKYLAGVSTELLCELQAIHDEVETRTEGDKLRLRRMYKSLAAEMDLSGDFLDDADL